MKMFNNTECWSEKINFVDENNVLVGYDMGQSCCEHADWFISDTIKKELLEDKPEDLDGWVFDPEFFYRIDKIDDDGWDLLDAGGMVVFRLIKDGKSRFLHLFNCHNGYYGHGFEMKIGEELKIEDYL